MKLYLFPASGRVVGIVALINYLTLDCEYVPIDLRLGQQNTDDYVRRNPNRKVPTLEDGDTELWESNAILFYLASQRQDCGLWPAEPVQQANVLRWLFWQSAHWDSEACGMVSFEKSSKPVLRLGPPDDAFMQRGVSNFRRFASVLDRVLAQRTWTAGDQMTIADFSIGGLIPTAQHLELPLAQFPHIGRWYAQLEALPAWQGALSAREAAIAALRR